MTVFVYCKEAQLNREKKYLRRHGSTAKEETDPCKIEVAVQGYSGLPLDIWVASCPAIVLGSIMHHSTIAWMNSSATS
ncbi:MAG: hypothetical protein IPQ25_17095 [Chitinophagaceae bacterium]|nr:hypothetical protein [Chitinophagaceae bacterium]